MTRLVAPLIAVCLIAFAALVVALSRPPASLPPVANAPTTFAAAVAPTTGPSVRVGVIGGMVETGFWDALAARYLAETGVTIELIVAGPKDRLERAMMRDDAGIDLLTMHASDTIVNLVADGYALDPQPWARNDMVIVGPPTDPAGVRGMADAVAAMRKIADAKAPVVVGASLGAQEVLRGLLEAGTITLDQANVTQLFNDDGRTVLAVAAEKGAYAMVGRIPFRSGKIPANGTQLMVAGDPRLCRPYLVVVANPAREKGVRLGAARALAAWLRGGPTQAWIATFGVGTYDDRPVFFPVAPSK